MATMVKEKRREKKKYKEKNVAKNAIPPELSPVATPIVNEQVSSPFERVESVVETQKITPKVTDLTAVANESEVSIEELVNTSTETVEIENSSISFIESPEVKALQEKTQTLDSKTTAIESQVTECGNVYENLNNRLKNVTIPEQDPTLDLESLETRLTHSNAYIQETACMDTVVEEVFVPSAPMLEEEIAEQVPEPPKIIEQVKLPKVKCMPLEEAIKMYGGKEIEEVKRMSEREEAIVEAGPVSGPEHPLVDLLSTLKSSFTSLEREKRQITCGFIEEKKFRLKLWKIEKRSVHKSEPCKCGRTIEFKAMYEHAELLSDCLPVAQMRLASLLKDVQDSYCHHLHALLLAVFQIDELIAETIRIRNKSEMREALCLVMQALRLSDGAPSAFATALQRWAAALAGALLDERSLTQLLLLLHQLFRQTRSVAWAAQIVQISIGDNIAAARAIALLDLLLAKPRLEAAVECVEDTEEAWEEVDERGGGGAVSDGSLRERDLLALLRAFPLAHLVARIVLVMQADINNEDYSWSDSTFGRGVLRACCGVRTLLHTLQRAVCAHAQYLRLRRRLQDVAVNALHALAILHTHNRSSYSIDLRDKIASELEAAFGAGVGILDGAELHTLPATLLADDTAHHYCVAICVALHDKSGKQLDCLPVEMAALSCEVRVRIVTQAAIDRDTDHELARIVLDFLIQTAVKRRPATCRGGCDVTAGACLPRLLAAHSYLRTIALHVLADLTRLEAIDGSCIDYFRVEAWRPDSGSARAVLDHWAQSCPHVAQQLLAKLDYTPHTGVSLESQLTIGSWVCSHVRTIPKESEEQWWSVLRSLRVHAVYWAASLDAPAPAEPQDMISTAYALMSSAWGHCVPLICSRGVEALCSLASVRPRDAVQCLAPILLVMAQSPESLSLTHKFTELMSTLLNAGPSLVQRALGRGGVTGADLLLRLIVAQLQPKEASGMSRPALVSAWLHAIWRPQLSGSVHTQLLDTLLLLCWDSNQVNIHADNLCQGDTGKALVTQSVRNVASAPLTCECLLRARHVQHEIHKHMWPRLLETLHRQRLFNQRIHVDNALQEIGCVSSSDELVIYRVAAACLSATPQHPAHLLLWRFFMHLYLQRAPAMPESSGAIGPLLFSGLIKSRTLAQLKRRLQDLATHHKNEAQVYEEKNNTNPPERPKRSNKIVKSESCSSTDELFPALELGDLTGESSESSDSSEEESEEVVEGPSEDVVEDLVPIMTFHMKAEKMLTQYLRWLEEGETVRAAPHHADVARFICDTAMEEAWKRKISRRMPTTPPSPSELWTPPRPPPQVTPQPQPHPYQMLLDRLQKINTRPLKRRHISIKSPVEDVNLRDAKSILAHIDKHLDHINNLAQEWNSEVSRISDLDSQLFRIIPRLRQCTRLPAVTRRCDHKCAPVNITFTEVEWRISLSAEKELLENRRSARTSIRRLCRPRPHAARTAAALHAIARRIGDVQTAAAAGERAWRSAGAALSAPAHRLLHALVASLAQRWICNDGKVCTDLISRWSSSRNSNGLQQSLVGLLVCPNRTAHAHWPALYTALLRADLPSHVIFSYLSRFEVHRWSEVIEPAARRDVLEALVAAVQRFGPKPDSQHDILLELLGVHTSSLVTARELCAHVMRCACASVCGALPPAHWTHVVAAVHKHASAVPCDQLGHVVRELGVSWWSYRTGIKRGKSTTQPAHYAPHMAALLTALQMAFAHAAVQLSYAPDRVGVYLWSSLQEGWSAWLCPSPTPPLLPSSATNDAHAHMLQLFTTTLVQLINLCPGSGDVVLQELFSWTAQSYLSSVGPAATQEAHAQAAAVLAACAQLPWTEHSWTRTQAINTALHISSTMEEELKSWCSVVWSGSAGATWLSDVTQDTLAPRLASLLCLYTDNMHFTTQTLDEATRLPWRRLPEAALEEALDRFFAVHHNPAHAYHDLPQFRVLIAASELSVSSPSEHATCASITGSSRRKRCVCVSAWTRAASQPALLAHAQAYAKKLLDILTDIGPYLESSEGELEELLGRGVIIMCIEPAAAAVLPVWESWVSSTNPRLVRACISAASVLTTFEYFASLAEAAVRAHITRSDCTGWSEVSQRWSTCHWRDATPLCARAHLHAAYALLRTHAHDYHALATVIMTLLAADINFVENSAIVSVWICVACRVWRQCAAGGGAAAAQCQRAAGSLLARWAQPHRRSLLHVVTMQADHKAPTNQHRLLCHLALCIIAPSAESSRAYSAAVTLALGPHPGDVASWGNDPTHKRLPRLAMRLHPNNDMYFIHELEMAPDNV